MQCLEMVYGALYRPRQHKQVCLESASAALDFVKLYIQLAQDLEGLSSQGALGLAAQAREVGRELGGLRRYLQNHPKNG